MDVAFVGVFAGGGGEPAATASTEGIEEGHRRRWWGEGQEGRQEVQGHRLPHPAQEGYGARIRRHRATTAAATAAAAATTTTTS